MADVVFTPPLPPPVAVNSWTRRCLRLTSNVLLLQPWTTPSQRPRPPRDIHLAFVVLPNPHPRLCALALFFTKERISERY